jgi:hypothetical protein
MIRAKMAEVDLTNAQVYRTLNISKGWFAKMIMKNERYKFDTPNEDRMQHIWNFLLAYEEFRKQWRL